MLAHVTEKVQNSNVFGPLPVVDHHRCLAYKVRVTLEPEERPELVGHCLRVAGQGFAVQQVALLGPAAGITDHPRGPSGQGDWPVSGVLEPTQQEQRNQVSDVEAVSRRVEAAVDGDRTLGQAGT